MSAEVAFLGAGLAPCLLALCVWRSRPDLTVWLLNTEDHLPDGELQPISLTAIPPDLAEIIDPLLVADWRDYHLLFADHARQLAGSVAMLAPDQLAMELLATFPRERMLFGGAASAEWWRARPESQRPRILIEWTETANAPGAVSSVFTRSYRFERPHGLASPVLIDASREWAGADFLQYLPLSDRSLQVRHVALQGGNRTEARVPLDPARWPGARLVRDHVEHVPRERTQAALGGPGRVLLPRLGARHGHPAYLSQVPELLWAASALAKATDMHDAALVDALGRAHERRAESFHAWTLVSAQLDRLPPRERSVTLASLYDPAQPGSRAQATGKLREICSNGGT